MDIKVIIMGIVQGLTEFFPVSSSGHLVILQDLFMFNPPGVSTEVFLHAGTLLAVTAVFYKDIIEVIKGFFSSIGLYKKKNGYEKICWMIIIANIPAGIAGVFFKDSIENFFASSRAAYVFLIITEIYLLVGSLIKNEEITIGRVGFRQAFIIGISQMFAILPGISRSGSTIITGKILKLKPEDAARFSFLIMLPAVGGATLLELKDFSAASVSAGAMIWGVITSFVIGFLALKILLEFVKEYRLHYFAYYCFALGFFGLFYLV